MGDLILRVNYNSQWQDLDVDSNIPLRLDISAVENTDIGGIFGVGSQTFNLPGTRRNNAFFRGAYKVGAEDVPAFYNTIDCTVLFNGEILLQGNLQLQEIITDQDGYIEYVVTVADESVNFITQLQSKLIKNANWNAYTHSLDATAISASWQGDLLSGSIFYPLVDLGTDTPDQYPQIPRIQVGGGTGSIDSVATPMQLKQFIPAVSARTLLDVIFDSVGYTYTSSLVDSDTFDNLYVLPKGSTTLGTVVSGSDGTVQAEIDNFSASFGPVITGQFDQKVIIYDNVQQQSGANYNASNGRYEISVDGYYEFYSELTFGNPSNFNSAAEVLFGAYKTTPGVGGGWISPTTASYPNGSGFNPDYGLFPSLTNQAGAFIESGSYVEARFLIYPGTPFNNANPIGCDVTAFFNGASSFTQNQTNINYAAAEIDMGEQFDNQAKSIDLLQGLLTQFNAVAVPEPGTSKTIRIENFEDFMAQGRDVDWTDKYETAQRISIKHPISEQPKQLLIKNVDDEDRFSKLSIDNDPNYQYGTIRVISDSTVAQGEKSVESYYAPITLAPIIQSGSEDSDGNPTFNLSLGNFVVPHLYRFNNNNQETFTFKPRLGYKVDNLYAAGNVGGVKIATGSNAVFSYSTLSNLSQLPATSTTKDLHFDNQYFDLMPAYFNPNAGITAFTTYWEKYINDLYLDEARKVTLDLKFSPTEYQNIKLNDRIFIYGEEYRLNKISGYNLQYNDVVKVELIKLATPYERAEDCTLVVSSSYDPSATPTPTPTGTATPTPTPTPTGIDCTLEVSASFDGSSDCTFNLFIVEQGCEFNLSIS